MGNQSLGSEMPCTQMCRLNHILWLLTGIQRDMSMSFLKATCAWHSSTPARKLRSNLEVRKRGEEKQNFGPRQEEGDQSCPGRSNTQWHWDKGVVWLSPCHAACGHLGWSATALRSPTCTRGGVAGQEFATAQTQLGGREPSFGETTLQESEWEKRRQISSSSALDRCVQ